MKNHSILCFLLLILIASIVSCKKETVESNEEDYFRYFPLNTGSWIEYSVDSIWHIDRDDHTIPLTDTTVEAHFQIREEVDTPFTDAVNETAYVIKRYRRDADTLPWTFWNLWISKRTNTGVERVEDNVRFVRMQFPIKSSAMWNGNAYNFFQEEEYSYEDIFEQRAFNGMQFPSTVTVLQNDFISNINRVKKEEIYAKDVGLIYKQLDSVRTANSGATILNGLEYRLTVINYHN